MPAATGRARACLAPGAPSLARLDRDRGPSARQSCSIARCSHGGSTAPDRRPRRGAGGEGIAALPLFVASLKDRESEAFLAEMFAALPPAIVLNTTAFAVSRIGAAHEGTVLDRPGRPVLQVVLAGSSEAAWRDSPRGLLPRDLTMNVVLPEVDGRLLTRAISFKAEHAARPATRQP